MSNHCVPLWEVEFGSKFVIPGDPTVYTHERGDGMFSKVTWIEDGKQKRGNLYIGEEVLCVRS